MWRARNGFTLLSAIIARCSAAAAQPSVAPGHPPTQSHSDEQRMADLVLASRILVQEGVLDSFGHVTVRSLKNPTHYFMPRAMPPRSTTSHQQRSAFPVGRQTLGRTGGVAFRIPISRISLALFARKAAL